MKYIKKLEKFNKKSEEIKKIIKNYEPYAVKYEDHKNIKQFSVLVKDKNSDFNSWVDIWVEDGEINSDWNQMIYYNDNEDDMVKKGVENDSDVYLKTESAALTILEENNLIYYDEDIMYHYSDYWYIKDGYKDEGFSLEDAKKIRKYNL